MKRILLLMLSVIVSTMMMADDVTPQQALEQASQFVKSRKARGGGPRLAPGTQPKLTLASRVSDLYVFNINGDAGYVIVSNDDVAVPILGYSDSGSFDANNIPDNMRAWLQGYADEIAWAKANHVKPVATPRRVGTHSTVSISPLMTTTWDQGYPYNAAVASATGYDLATGCVATAMAQVMYYTEIKAENNTTTTTQKIPEYNTQTYGLPMDPISAGTIINWGDMINDYSGNYTSAQATAVANLMLYCGCSVQMNYGPSSGAHVVDVATALKSYFGYATTTQYVNRSFYTYANWVDLIYNELSQGRPVVYGGQAADNGHAFVCDGYLYDDGDLFHINWGWSGASDGYFVLSVLNPSEQGIGGSSSNSAYTFGQEAVVGIQKIGDTGTVLDVPSNAPALSLISTSASHATIALGESIDVTVRVKNLSTTVAYDGDILLGVNQKLGVGKVFEIAPGETKDCVITFTPSEVGSYTLGAFIPNPSGAGNYLGNYDLGGSFNVVNQTPTNLTASDLTYYWAANIGWTNVGDATKWNLRKRTVDITEEDFASNPGWATQKWSTKGGWVYSANGGIDDTPCYVSPSYKSGEDQDPDVGLCTPYFSLGGSISFYAWGEAAEHFALLLQIEGSTQLYYLTDFYETTSTPSLYTFDLSSLSGNTGRICINHCNSSGHTSASSLHVDNVNIIAPQGAWTTTEDVTTNPYALEGLSALTSYEVQIQPVVNDGGNWSNSVVFTTTNNALTLLNDDSEADPDNTDLITAWNGHSATLTFSGRSLTGGDNWNTCCLPIDLPISTFKTMLSLAGYDASDISFKVFDVANTTLNDAGKLTLKFTDATGTIAAGTPFIVKYGSSSSITLPTIPPAFANIDGSAEAKARMTQTSADGRVNFVGKWSSFPITDANINEILYVGTGNKIGYSKSARTLKSFRAHFYVPVESGAPMVKTVDIDFGDGETTSIDLISNDDALRTEGWFTVDGRRLDGEPTQKGVYIHNGKKVIK